MTAKKPRGRPPYEDLLTPAEWRIAHAVRHGMSNREIASRRGISLDGVKFHVANIVAKLGLADRRVLRGWTGIPRQSALAQSGGEASMTATAAFGALGQIARSVSDIAAAEHWYGSVLGLPHLYTFGQLAFFDCGGVRLMLSAIKGETASASILYFAVPDIVAACRDLEAQGVVFTHVPHMIHRHADGTEEWMAFFTDNEGRPLALMARAAPKAQGAQAAMKARSTARPSHSSSDGPS